MKEEEEGGTGAGKEMAWGKAPRGEEEKVEMGEEEVWEEGVGEGGGEVEQEEGEGEGEETEDMEIEVVTEGESVEAE